MLPPKVFLDLTGNLLSNRFFITPTATYFKREIPSGGGGGNRTHVRRVISNADYVCSFEFSSQSEDYKVTSTFKLGDFKVSLPTTHLPLKGDTFFVTIVFIGRNHRNT